MEKLVSLGNLCCFVYPTPFPTVLLSMPTVIYCCEVVQAFIKALIIPKVNMHFLRNYVDNSAIFSELVSSCLLQQSF